MGFLAHLGPLTRTVTDTALAKSVIGRPDSRDMTAMIEPPPDFVAGLAGGVKGLLLAWSPRLGGDVTVDPEIAALTEAAALAFRELGATVEEVDPGFAHHKANEIPTIEDAGTRLTLIAGSSDGLVSPVKTFSDMVYADIALQDGARYQLKAEHVERAIYVVQGEVEVIGQTGGFATGELVVFKPGAEIILRAKGATRLMLMGGEPLPEKRHIFWNFVSSSPDRIEQAKADWQAQRFAPVPDEHEFIPLPA